MAAGWIRTGHGSYRRVSRDKFELLYRPFGHAGPQRRRRVNWSRKRVVAFLLNEAVQRQRQGLGLAPVLGWTEAREAYLAAQLAKGDGAKYIGQCAGLIDSVAASCRVELPAVQPAHLDRWRQQRAKALKARERKGWARTVNKEIVMLGGFFRHCVKVLRAVPFNPAEPLAPYPHQPPTDRNLTPLEFRRVLDVSEPSLQDLLQFLLWTGCRFGEAAAMGWAALQARPGETWRWLIPDRKAGDTLKMPLAAPLAELVNRQPRLPDGLVWHRWVPPSSRAHGHHPEDPITDSWLINCLRVRCSRVGVERFKPHDLRHAAATWLRQSGTPLDQIQSLLGHSTVTTTEIYARSDALSCAERLQQTLIALTRKGA